MTAKEKLEQIKSILKRTFADQSQDGNPAKSNATGKETAAGKAPADPSQDGKTYPLADGTTITLMPGLEIGAEATIDGKPAPDGEYPLPDGTVIECKDGEVTEIETEDAASGASEASGANGSGAVNLASDYRWLRKQVESLLSRFKAHEKTILLQKQTIEAQRKELKFVREAFRTQKEDIFQLVELMEAIVSQPAVRPTEPKKSPFAKNKNSEEERISLIAESMRKMREEQ